MIIKSSKSDTFPPITFFYTDNCERQALEPIADEATRRGIEVRFSNQSSERAEIGVYCEHACRPCSDFSVVMLHDLAQRHDVWPKFWHFEPWDKFDIGLLPGASWVERWQTQAEFSVTRPRLGMFDNGWPKADLVFKDKERFAQEAKELRLALGLKHEKSVLYAPSWENNGKQDDFVKAFKDLPVNVLLKQAPWPSAYPVILENIRQMNELHRGCAENVHIIDTNVSIMYCLGLADVLVSDESSVLIEALLLDVPGVAVTDWLIPDTNPPRPASVPFDFVTKTTKAELRPTVEAILAEPENARQKTREHRDRQFSHLGCSSVRVMDTIEAAIRAREFPYPPIVAQVDLDRAECLHAEQLIETGQREKAAQILFALANKETACWEAFNGLGVLMFKEGDLGAATLLLGTAVSRAQNPVTALANLIEVHCAAERPSEALTSLAQLVKHIPKSKQTTLAIKACMIALLSGEMDH